MRFKAESGETYVSLVYAKSDYYASWDPSRPVRLGDYGRLRADYSFATEGNIFDKGFAQIFGITTHTGPAEECRCIVSRHVEEVKQNTTCEMGVSWLHKMKIGQSFTVNRSHGAILLMVKPQLSTLEPAGVLNDLVYSTALRKRQLLISELYHCPSYARLLAPQQRRAVKIGLEAGIPHPEGFMQGKENVGWVHTADGGDFMSGIVERGNAAFTPLFRLVGRECVTIRKLPVLELQPPKWRRVVNVDQHAYIAPVDPGKNDEPEDDDGHNGFDCEDMPMGRY